jgi:hypothetical protein
MPRTALAKQIAVLGAGCRRCPKEAGVLPDMVDAPALARLVRPHHAGRGARMWAVRRTDLPPDLRERPRAPNGIAL